MNHDIWLENLSFQDIMLSTLFNQREKIKMLQSTEVAGISLNFIKEDS